jgi:hypothetical protein
MNRANLYLFVPACLLLSLACGADDEQPPEQPAQPEPGVYHLSVMGEVESSLSDELSEELPDSIELEWPDSMTINLISYDESASGSERCTDLGCTFGNAELTVDGAAASTAIIERDGDAADLRLVINNYPFRPVEPQDCPFTIPWVARFALRFEDGRVHGSGETMLECIVTQEDAPPLHQYFLILHLELAGESLLE